MLSLWGGVDCSCNLIIDRMLYLLNSRPVIRLHISYVIIRVLLPLLITFSIFFYLSCLWLLKVSDDWLTIRTVLDKAVYKLCKTILERMLTFSASIIGTTPQKVFTTYSKHTFLKDNLVKYQQKFFNPLIGVYS